MTTRTSASPPARVFLVGYYGVGNVGDEAVRTAIEQAARRLGVVVVRFATRTPSADPRAVPVRGGGLSRYAKAVLETDRVVLGGGGILKDEGMALPVELFLTAVFARCAGRPVALAAVGVGPFYTRLGRALVAATARLASVRTVRDDESAAELRRLAVARVEVGADPVFTLAPSSAPPARHPVGDEAPELLVSVRPWFRGPGAEAARAALRAAVGEAARAATAAGWKVTFVPLYWPRDHDEAARVVADCGLAGVELVDAPLGWDELAARVSRADLVLAMRYHAVVCAALHGRPTIALAYEPKVAALARELAIPSFDVSSPAAAADACRDLAPAVEAALAERPPAPERDVVVGLAARADVALRRALMGDAAG